MSHVYCVFVHVCVCVRVLADVMCSRGPGSLAPPFPAAGDTDHRLLACLSDPLSTPSTPPLSSFYLPCLLPPFLFLVLPCVRFDWPGRCCQLTSRGISPCSLRLIPLSVCQFFFIPFVLFIALPSLLSSLCPLFCLHLIPVIHFLSFLIHFGFVCCWFLLCMFFMSSYCHVILSVSVDLSPALSFKEMPYLEADVCISISMFYESHAWLGLHCRCLFPFGCLYIFVSPICMYALCWSLSWYNHKDKSIHHSA